MNDTTQHYYFAYGANTNLDSMARRCPAAVSMGSAALFDWRLRFAYHADVVPVLGQRVSGVLWRLTDQCLASLDQFEGYPDYYERTTVPVVHHNTVYHSLVYYMTPGHEECPPSEHYWRTLLTGYQHNNVTQRQLWQALQRSYGVDSTDEKMAPLITSVH